ncbi:MAG: GNAT family N-acetyltransferase [Muribaculaceae bacterium]|nr:GNAT family N-acetyltransferase [Muribaculaceae bacterium]
MLHSNRLHLRALEPGDADFMFEVENDAEAWRYSDTIAPLSRRILRDYALNYDADPFSAAQLRLIITEEGNNMPVGIVDLYELSQRHLRAFIGIYICKEFRGKGYAEETLRLIEEYAQNTLHLHQLGAKIEENHTQAVSRFENLGYKCSGRLEEWLSAPNGKYSNMLIYTKSLK